VKGVVQIQVTRMSADGPIVEYEEAFVVFDSELSRRAQHALAFDAAQLAELDHEGLAVFARRQLRSDERAGHVDARAHVRCAADDLQRRAGSGVDFADVQAVRVRMLRHRQHLGDDHAAERWCGRTGLFDFHAGHRQQFGQLGGGDRRIAVLAQPGFRKLHGSGIS
jgi:hypothetical protein